MWICGVVVSGKFVGEIGRDGHVKCCMEAYRRMCGKEMVGRAYSKRSVTASIVILYLERVTYRDEVITYYILDSINILSRYQIYVIVLFTNHNL